jgi:hypothetical protein
LQHPSGTTLAAYPRINSIEEGVGAVLLGIIEGKSLLKMRLRCDQLSEDE